MRSLTPILIAGGGIGGLTAAIALRRAGFEVRVFERAPEFREVGAGITLQSNGILALRRIALDEVVVASGRVVGSASIRTPDGKILSRAGMSEVAREVGAPSVAIHRATLQRLLLDAAGPVETGREVVGYEAREDGVTVQFRGPGRTAASWWEPTASAPPSVPGSLMTASRSMPAMWPGGV